MTTHARVFNGSVAEIWTPPDFAADLPPPPVQEEFAGVWIECGKEVEPNWTWSKSDGFQKNKPLKSTEKKK